MADEMREFAEAFGLDAPVEEETDSETEEEVEDEQVDEETEEESEDESEDSEEEESEEEESEEESKETKSKAQANYAFAQLRQQNKQLTSVLRDVGKLLGLDSNADNNAIVEGVKQAVLQQNAKNQGVPVETLEKISQLESLVEENERIKLEKQTSDDFTDLIEEFDLDADALNEFTQYLIDNDLNPLEGKVVDLKAEYLKLHWAEMLEAARDEALESDQKRREKAKNHSGGGAPEKKGDVSKDGDYAISSMADLNDFLSKQNL